MAPSERLDTSIDHYRVLGVARSADSPTIRKAYLKLARQHHPDRLADASAADRSASDALMRQVNEAWRVLGDEKLKRRYDKARSPSVTSSTSAVRTASTSYTPSHDPSGGDFVVASPKVAAAMQYGPWLAGATLLIAIFVFTAYAASTGGSESVSSGLNDWVVRGDCIQFEGPGNYRPTSCDGPHDGVIDELRADEACADPAANAFEPRTREVVFCLVDPNPG